LWGKEYKKGGGGKEIRYFKAWGIEKGTLKECPKGFGPGLKEDRGGEQARDKGRGKIQGTGEGLRHRVVNASGILEEETLEGGARRGKPLEAGGTQRKEYKENKMYH